MEVASFYELAGMFGFETSSLFLCLELRQLLVAYILYTPIEKEMLQRGVVRGTFLQTAVILLSDVLRLSYPFSMHIYASVLPSLASLQHAPTSLGSYLGRSGERSVQQPMRPRRQMVLLWRE